MTAIAKEIEREKMSKPEERTENSGRKRGRQGEGGSGGGEKKPRQC